jgi:hypothetical protein
MPNIETPGSDRACSVSRHTKQPKVHMHSSSVRSLVKLLACAAIGVSTLLPAFAADPSGAWAWTTPGRNGGPERKTTLTLKVEGEKVTGKVSSPGRDGQAMESEISDGKLAGEDLSFTVTREFNGNKFVAKYAGKVSADSIKGKIETERGDQKQSRDWEAKRDTEKKADEKK